MQNMQNMQNMQKNDIFFKIPDYIYEKCKTASTDYRFPNIIDKKLFYVCTHPGANDQRVL